VGLTASLGTLLRVAGIPLPQARATAGYGMKAVKHAQAAQEGDERVRRESSRQSDDQHQPLGGAWMSHTLLSDT
jgi:hypothetical protein